MQSTKRNNIFASEFINMSTINTDNIQSQMKKGLLEFCILSIIRRGESYPSDIVAELKDSGMQILEGTIYPLLTRLKNAGYLEYRWVESTTGPPRKYFTMSETGKEFYLSLQKTWIEISTAVEHITKARDLI